jgi:uncharacterized protein (TIGR03067 family)
MSVKMLCLPLLVGLVLAQAAGEDQARKDLKRLQGTWTMAALEVEGKDVPADRLEGTTLTVEGDRYRVKTKDRTLECVIRLDPGKDPAHIDMTFTEAGKDDKVHKGLYQIDGDTFRVSRGLNPEQDRPREFATWPGTGRFVVTWKRLAQ